MFLYRKCDIIGSVKMQNSSNSCCLMQLKKLKNHALRKTYSPGKYLVTRHIQLYCHTGGHDHFKVNQLYTLTFPSLQLLHGVLVDLLRDQHLGELRRQKLLEHFWGGGRQLGGNVWYNSLHRQILVLVRKLQVDFRTTPQLSYYCTCSRV